MLLSAAGCAQDPVIGEWRNDGSVGPHGLDGRLSLLESGNATYVSHGSSGLGLIATLGGEWVALPAEDGPPRYEVRLGCRPPGMFDSSGHCSTEPTQRSTCSLDNERLSCPDAALEGALRFLRAP